MHGAEHETVSTICNHLVVRKIPLHCSAFIARIMSCVHWRNLYEYKYGTGFNFS